MPIANMQGLAVHELCKLYDAEYRFLEGQEEMAQMASGQDLQGSIQQHLEQSRGHAKEPGAGLRPSGLGAPARD